MNDFSISVDKQKELARQLDILLWFFKSIQADSTIAVLHLYDLKTGCKEHQLESYHRSYKKNAEIAEAAAAIRAKHRNQ